MSGFAIGCGLATGFSGVAALLCVSRSNLVGALVFALWREATLERLERPS